MISVEKNSVMIEQINETVYIVRGFPSGGFYPQPYMWVGSVVVRGLIAYYTGWLFKDDAKISASQARHIHNFFKNLGCTERVYDRVTQMQFRQIRAKIK
jgi:hypothetical protein